MTSDAASARLSELDARLALIAASGEISGIFAGAGLARNVSFAPYRNGSAFLVRGNERA